MAKYRKKVLQTGQGYSTINPCFQGQTYRKIRTQSLGSKPDFGNDSLVAVIVLLHVIKALCKTQGFFSAI